MANVLCEASLFLLLLFVCLQEIIISLLVTTRKIRGQQTIGGWDWVLTGLGWAEIARSRDCR